MSQYKRKAIEKKDDPMGYMKIEEEYFDLACFIASQFFSMIFNGKDSIWMVEFNFDNNFALLLYTFCT